MRGGGVSRGTGHRLSAAAAGFTMSKSGPCGGVVLAESRSLLRLARLGSLAHPARLSVSVRLRRFGLGWFSLPVQSSWRVSRPVATGFCLLCLCFSMTCVVCSGLSVGLLDLVPARSPGRWPASRPRALAVWRCRIRAQLWRWRCGSLVVWRARLALLWARLVQRLGLSLSVWSGRGLGRGSDALRASSRGHSAQPFGVRCENGALAVRTPPCGSSRRSNVYGWHGPAKTLVTKDFYGFAPECAALGARVRACRNTKGRKPA